VSIARDFVDSLRLHPDARLLQPGPRYWEIFEQLCIASGACGNLIADAAIAALAVEHDCELFPSVRSRHPLTGA
jgi:predicted nucleic acid-binding protein